MYDREAFRQSLAIRAQRMELVTDIYEGFLGFAFLIGGFLLFHSAGLFTTFSKWTGEWYEPTPKRKLQGRIIAVFVMLWGLFCLYRAFFV